MDIKCRKLTCQYNDNWVCKAKKIKIAHNTNCASHILNPSKCVKDNTKTLFSKTPQFENYRHIQDVPISCDANCFFNCNHECLSNGITVLCGEDDPICGTYLKK